MHFKQLISNSYELCNIVLYSLFIAWKCEEWFTKALAKNMMVMFSLFDICCYLIISVTLGCISEKLGAKERQLDKLSVVLFQ